MIRKEKATRPPRAPKQQAFVFRTWGGKRKGAGRKPVAGRKAGVAHRAREAFPDRFPAHVTLRMLPHVWNLRSRRCFNPIFAAFKKGADRFGFRLVHYSVQGNHIHLLCEAADKRALARGIQGLSIRIAKALNRVMDRKGHVFADRYHVHRVRTPRETRNALAYLRQNAQHHYGPQPVGADAYASAAPVVPPVTWLLRVGWQKGARGAQQ